MKPFNLQQAKNGAPVCTKNGHKVRIICFDKKGTEYPIAAFITEELANGTQREIFEAFDKYGKRYHSRTDGYDLMMVDTEYKYTKKYVNLYEEPNLTIIADGPFKTKKEAKSMIVNRKRFVTTLEIQCKNKK